MTCHHGSYLENLVMATPHKLLDGFKPNFTYGFLLMASCALPIFGSIQHPRGPPSWKSWYRYSSETTGGILTKFQVQVPGEVYLCLTEDRSDLWQPSWKSCYRYFSETTGLILTKFHLQVPWWCLVVPNQISDLPDIQDGHHGSLIENLVIATPQKLLEGF